MQTEQTETNESSLAEDRLVGVEAIAEFIDPNLSLWKAQRLLEEGYYPHWREGKIYVASKAALLEHWIRMTRGFKPEPPKHEADDQGEAA
jgi:RNase H-fold protein (predicted Holliday junction resolvase)